MMLRTKSLKRETFDFNFYKIWNHVKTFWKICHFEYEMAANFINFNANNHTFSCFKQNQG